ncbi:30S ribosomal protein S20 [Desulfoferrobacter suflitae]|uniref:30S ribosomal protein S20 n=1 Tax=Desulfoferrobacter suflitae TaxID=2865782 RepID=UPI0021640601|nr:30S ribosomal protein S20 [Desulfoferrobacter suflitae]MCK8603269.1 30S ribosomal protein S20 [Desulfoferrobacter suflitae]
MANHPSAIKRAKQNEKRRVRNRARKTRMKNVINNLEDALASNARDVVQQSLKEAISVIDRTAQKGVIHKNKAARKISRLTQRVNALLQAEGS